MPKLVIKFYYQKWFSFVLMCCFDEYYNWRRIQHLNFKVIYLFLFLCVRCSLDYPYSTQQLGQLWQVEEWHYWPTVETARFANRIPTNHLPTMARWTLCNNNPMNSWQQRSKKLLPAIPNKLLATMARWTLGNTGPTN